jgi:SAM-dependent methyltransferase
MSGFVPEFGFRSEEGLHTVPILREALFMLLPELRPGMRILDIGCGNGYWVGEFLSRGLRAVGVDPSSEGIAIARAAHPTGRFEQLTVAPDILGQLDEEPFDIVFSTEVVEHLYDPRAWAAGAFNALKPGGRIVCSTPYHGYWKNLALAIAGRWDGHANPLWDGGHIKLWSRNTLSQLLREAGFVDLKFRGAGRLPYIWMGMVMSGDRPGAEVRRLVSLTPSAQVHVRSVKPTPDVTPQTFSSERSS